MRHCTEVGRVPCDELVRQLREAGEEPDDDEDGYVFCELTAGHPGEHADHLADGEPEAQLWVRWSGDRHRFVRLAPCMAPAPAREDGADDICHLYRGHEPRHSWDLVGLLYG